MGDIRHWGDFTCEEFEEFRTFYMTCICGWRVPVKIMEGRFREYYLQNMWNKHIGSLPLEDFLRNK